MTATDRRLTDDATAFLSEGYLLDNGVDVQRLSVAVYRLLATGRPVDLKALTSALQWQEPQVEAVLVAFPPSAIEFDGAGAIIAFIGLSLEPTDHLFEVDGQALHTWCALDALFLPEILSKTARVTTTCPATGDTIRLKLTADRIAEAEPEHPVMSVVAPDGEACRSNLRGAFCNHINLFADEAAFDRWANSHPGAASVPLAEAFAMGRQRNAARYPDVEL